MKPYAGPCFGYFEKWHFDTKTKKCDTFIYGGCRGNANNFETEEECKNTCQQHNVEKGNVLLKI